MPKHTPNLANSLVLFGYMLKLLGYEKWEDISRDLHHPRYEEIASDGHTEMAHFLASRLRGYVPPCGLTPLAEAKLYEYDENIRRHTKKINSSRRSYGEEISWRYFQYLSLLFTEVFLDRLLGNGTQFQGELNYYLEHCLKKEAEKDYGFLSDYGSEDLRKIAFWMATGSGKTLIMHMNYLQFQHYAQTYGLWKNINQVILLTPNPGLSRQHLEECQKSGLPAMVFSKNKNIPLRGTIQIMHIQKIRQEGKEETVSVEEFGERNFVLVDEGHKGAGGVEWFDIREKLCRGGFSFEYSATFGQAIKYSTGKNAKQQRDNFDRYAKTILFDYSYKHFYEDGFGKDYRIYNIGPGGGKNTLSKTERDLYLTTGLLTLYQQVELFQQNPRKASEFNLEKPLWIFIGGKVVSGKRQSQLTKEQKEEISDVWKVVHFLAEFLCKPKEAIERIKQVIEGKKSGLKDRAGRDLFPEGYFKHLPEDPEAIYKGILERVFNELITDSSDGRATRKLELVHFKDSEGEIGLRLKGRPYFGLINIGAPDAFLKSGGHPCVSIAPAEPFTKSLFEKINHPESPVNILIGARKFTEGWNSWRVSVMGLINFGKSEGPLVIQLFGRGVRLKGYRFSLKRSRALRSLFPEADPPDWLPELETLYVFGIEADYIAKFEEYLKKEGVPTSEKVRVCILPVIYNLIPTKETFLCKNNGALLGVRLRDQVRFPDKGSIVKLNGTPEQSIVSRPIKLDWSARAVVHESVSTTTGSTSKPKNLVIPRYLLELLDWEDIYREIDRYRTFKGMRNLVFSKDSLKYLILAAETQNNRWYELYGPSYLLSFEHLEEIKQVILILLKKYLDRLYEGERRKWELETVGFECYPVSINDSNFEFKRQQGGYRIEISSEAKCAYNICNLVNTINQAINCGQLKDHDFCNGACRVLFFERHLYSPLIYVIRGNSSLAIKVSPVPFEESELCFVECLRRWCYRNEEDLQKKNLEIYLLRNQSGKGMKFSLSSGDFYPDFILWICIPGICIPEVQYITFIDPKGLHNIPLDHPKIKLAQEIKKIERKLNESQISNCNTKVVLNSFILSPTHYRNLVDSSYRNKTEDELAEKHHVLFMDCQLIKAKNCKFSSNMCQSCSCLSSCFVEKLFMLLY